VSDGKYEGDLRALSGSLSLPLAIALAKKKRFMVRVHMIWRKKKREESRRFLDATWAHVFGDVKQRALNLHW